ncbi:hypothetical protein [Bacteroides acidifaciens]|uniref:hypothetical protein n=1 Tax=Bacteroides acidifaciens TaxID=85831 RepID=UPI0026EAE2C3|nr:hypothetical protein [Bacteroides acidifaciens]
MNTTGYITSSSNDVLIPASKLGDATASDVLKGKTFTSAAGLKVTGTVASKGALATCRGTANWEGLQYGFKFDTGAYLEGYSGGDHPMVTVPYGTLASTIGLTAGKIIKGNTILGIAGTGQTGVDTSDADATAANILKNKTAYVNGSKITGTMKEIKDYYKPTSETIGLTTRTSYTNSQGDSFTVPSTKYLYIRMNTTGYITSSSNDVLIPASKLGDATASDVLKGKSFTSINGVKITGTHFFHVHDIICDYKQTTIIKSASANIFCNLGLSGYMGKTYYSPSNPVVTFNIPNLSSNLGQNYYIEIIFNDDLGIYNQGIRYVGNPRMLIRMVFSPFNVFNVVRYKYAPSATDLSGFITYNTVDFRLIPDTESNTLQLILFPRDDDENDKFLLKRGARIGSASEGYKRVDMNIYK